MASADAIDGAAVAALESRQVTPIAQLSPELPDQNSQSVRGEVTITWPYNRVTHTLAFLLAEPDVRLRRTKGQVRVQLHGPSAKAVADCGLGACDEVLLSLEGVEWTKDESPGNIPGARVDWQLQFTKKLILQAKLNGVDEPKHINVDSEQSELPDELPELSTIQQLEQSVVEPKPAVIEQLSAIRKVPDITSNEYPSPAFIKRARLSYGSLFEDGLDIFEEDGGIKGKGRKRSRFTPKTKTWRYSSKSPTPEPDCAPKEDQDSPPLSPENDAMEEDAVTETAGPKPKMTDGASQTIESEMTSIPPTSEQTPAEKTEAVSHPATWEEDQAGHQETSKDTTLPETEVAQAASHILGMANGTMSQPYPFQHTDHQAQANSISLFGSSRPAVSGLSMFGTPASVPVESEYGIANQVRFGFSHTPQVPQPGVPRPQMQAAPEFGPYPDSYLDHPAPAKYEGMESYMNIAQNNPELQHGQDYNIIPVPAGMESFERGQWEMATQAPHYNPVEGGHFGPDALNEGTPAIIEDPSLHADPTRPDQVPKGFSSYGRASEGPAGFEEPEELEQEAEESGSDELVENEEVAEVEEDGIGGDSEVQYDEYGDDVEEGDYDQREYLEPESDDEGLNQDEEEVELEVAERYGEGDVYDEDNEDEEMGDYAEDWGGERRQYEDEDEDEDDYEAEDKDLGQSLPRRAPAAAAPVDPVVISLLSDSEDEDEAPPPPQPAAPTSRPTMTRQLSIRHSSPPARANTSAETGSPQKQGKSPVVEKEPPTKKEESTVKHDVAMEEPTEDQSKPSVGRLKESSPADQKDRGLHPKEEAKLVEPAMTIVHTELAAGTDTEEGPSSSVVQVKDLTSETGAKDTEPPKTSNTKPTEQPGEDVLPKAEDDELEEQRVDDKSEVEANDETFEGFSSDAEIIEKVGDNSESEEDDEVLDEVRDEDEEDYNEMLEEEEEEEEVEDLETFSDDDEGVEEEHDGNDDQVVDLLDTTSEEDDEEEDEDHDEDHSDFEPVESESEEEMHPEIHEDYKVTVDGEATKEAEKNDDKELVVEIEQKKVEVDQGVAEKVEEAEVRNDGNVDKITAAEATTKAEEVKETDAGVSEVKDANSDVQEVKAEQGHVNETATTADQFEKEETQADQSQAQGPPSPVTLEESVEETKTVEEEQVETNNVLTTSDTKPGPTVTVTSPADEGHKAPDRVAEVDEMEAIQHQLFEDMTRASREASMMEVSDAEHVSVMSQDTPRPVPLDSDEEMGDGDDEDVDMEDVATPRPEPHTEEGQVSQAVEVDMTSEAIEVDSDIMSVTHEESAEVEITEAPQPQQDSDMGDAEMVVEETQVTVATEVTVTEAPAAQQPQASPFAAVDVIDHAPQQAVLPSSPPPTQPFASQVAEDEVMLVGSSSPAKEAVREKSLPTPNQSGLLGQEVTESLQHEEAQAAADTVVEESTEVVIEETETTTTEPQPATTEEGVETQDEVSLIVVEEESEKQTQDVNSNQTDKAKEVTSTIEPTDDETSRQKEESSQTTATPAQSQSVNEKDADLSDNLTRQIKKTPAKRGRKSQQPALEPLRSSARLTRARSGSVSKSFTTTEDNDEAKPAALASPSKRSFASSFNSSVPPSEDNTTPQPTTSHADKDDTANSNDPATLKLSLSRLLRSQPQFANCLTLKSIRNHLGQNVDIVAIVSSQPTNPVRAKGGPREYMMSFNVTDPSTAPAHVVEVQMYRPHKESLPIVKPGDAILLKQVEIRSFSAGKGFGLRTGDGSAWAVFEVTAEDEQGVENGDAAATTNQAPPQIKGSPVQNWEEFVDYMTMLKKWYRLLMRDQAAKGKLEKAVKKFEK